MKKKILLCVSGGIAAYKAIDLASRLVKLGFAVKTILTPNATKFVTPLNFAAITHESVHVGMFDDADAIPHITLADWADLIVVAPATANVMAKAVHGIADDLLSAVMLAHTKPILFVPAMNVNMYANPATQANLGVLKDREHHVMLPETGMLACGYEGRGKYPPNAEVAHAVQCYLEHGEDLSGKKVLITAGATAEPIDPMRTISNRSSGKMGLALARALALRGADVTLIYANVDGDIPYYLHKSKHCPTVDEMYAAVLKERGGKDWIIKCAAVSDYKPEASSAQKIKKADAMTLKLIRTPDILAELGKKKPSKQKLIGFAAETEKHIENALHKLETKHLDMICLNDLNTAGSDATSVTIITKAPANNDNYPVLSGTKLEVAHHIINYIKQI